MFNSSIYPIKINRYQPPNKGKQQAVQQEKDGQTGSSANKEQQTEQKEPNYNTIYRPTPGYYANGFGQYGVNKKPQNLQNQQNNQNSQLAQTNYNTQMLERQAIQPQIATQNARQNVNQNASQNAGMTRQTFPNGEKTAIDYTQSKINISQVIKDFQNTAEAIGSPDDIKETVYTYVSLVKKEAEKEKPNKKIIQSNLKNASHVLDEYITDTLKKPSKVVEGWIDALFLQNVDYRYDENVINPDYLVKLPKNKKNATATGQAANIEGENTKTAEQAEQSFEQSPLNLAAKQEQNPFYSLLVDAKREKNPAEALNMYAEIIGDAELQDDKKAMSIAYFESGKLYDGFNSFDKALENYENAVLNSDDDGMKAQAYLKMAQIRHESSNPEKAGEDYFSSVGYFGEVENPKAQAVVMAKTGKLMSEQYDAKMAKEYFDIADILANETGDKSLIGRVNQKAGEAFGYLDEPREALSYYGKSASSFDEIQNNYGLAKDYQQAAQLMLGLGNTSKAKKLLFKAFKAGVKSENQELISHIQSQIAVLG